MTVSDDDLRSLTMLPNSKDRQRKIRNCINRKLDDELERQFLKEREEPDGGYWEINSAIEAARNGNYESLRRLRPQLAEFLNPPKKEGRGGDRRSKEAKAQTKEKRETYGLALLDYRNIVAIRKKYNLKSVLPDDEIEEIAVLRWSDRELTDEDLWAAKDELHKALRNPAKYKI